MVENAIFIPRNTNYGYINIGNSSRKEVIRRDTQNKNSSRTQLRNEIHHHGYSGKGKRV